MNKKIVKRHVLRILKKAKKLSQLEVGIVSRKAFKFLKIQAQIRPRARLFSKLIVILTIAFLASNQTLAYIKPKEAEVKINGHSILAQSEPDEPLPVVEINHSIGAKRSPFDFKMPVNGYVSQGYRGYHRALDIATGAVGVPIHALGAGTVEFTGFQAGGKGNVVIVDHGDGLKSLYAHMGKIQVGVGNQVDSNTTLGAVGMTGRTTGPHVHLEVYDNDAVINPDNVLPN